MVKQFPSKKGHFRRSQLSNVIRVLSYINIPNLNLPQKQEYNCQISYFSCLIPPDGICIADLNKDGKNDIAVTNQGDGTVMILLNK